MQQDIHLAATCHVFHLWRTVSIRILLGVLLGGLVFTLNARTGGALPTFAQETDDAVHVVQAGETLSEIAQSYGVTTDEVMRLNGITNADAIFVGQTLRMPPASQVSVDAEVVAEVAAEVEGETSETEAEEADSSATNESTTNESTTNESTTNEGEHVDAVQGSASFEPVNIASLNSSYTVRYGETLPAIALRYDLDLAALRALNQISADNAIRAGQQLILPAMRDELRVSAPPVRYTVQPGDSLGLIAQAHDTTLDALMSLNRINNPDLIQPGQELLIPALSSSEPAPRIGPAQSGFYYHTVRVGETPSELAQQFDSTPQAIARYNGLPDIATLYSGLEVRIPYGPPILDRRTPPAPRSGTEFVISISRQRCWVMQGDQVRHEWKCSTGQGEWVTRTGTFPIQSKIEVAQSSAYRLDMPYWLGLYDVGAYENGIHGLPVEWSTGEKLWDTLIGQPATFGCAMLYDEDAALLFDLAYLGMPVHIVD